MLQLSQGHNEWRNRPAQFEVDHGYEEGYDTFPFHPNKKTYWTFRWGRTRNVTHSRHGAMYKGCAEIIVTPFECRTQGSCQFSADVRLKTTNSSGWKLESRSVAHRKKGEGRNSRLKAGVETFPDVKCARTINQSINPSRVSRSVLPKKILDHFTRGQELCLFIRITKDSASAGLQFCRWNLSKKCDW